MRDKQITNRIIGIIIIIISIILLYLGIVILNSDISFPQRVVESSSLILISLPLFFFGAILTKKTRKNRGMFLLSVGITSIMISPLFLISFHSLNLFIIYFLINILIIILGIMLLYKNNNKEQKEKEQKEKEIKVFSF